MGVLQAGVLTKTHGEPLCFYSGFRSLKL